MIWKSFFCDKIENTLVFEYYRDGLSFLPRRQMKKTTKNDGKEWSYRFLSNTINSTMKYLSGRRCIRRFCWTFLFFVFVCFFLWNELRKAKMTIEMTVVRPMRTREKAPFFQKPSTKKNSLEVTGLCLRGNATRKVCCWVLFVHVDVGSRLSFPEIPQIKYRNLFI